MRFSRTPADYQTGRHCRQRAARGFKHPCGSKTGTTNNYTNAWFCGFTTDLTAAVWVGFDRPTMIADKAYGGTKPAYRSGWESCGAPPPAALQMKDIRTAPAAAQQRHTPLRTSRWPTPAANMKARPIETMADFTKPPALHRACRTG